MFVDSLNGGPLQFRFALPGHHRFTPTVAIPLAILTHGYDLAHVARDRRGTHRGSTLRLFEQEM
jgi:hypothetical protein